MGVQSRAHLQSPGRVSPKVSPIWTARTAAAEMRLQNGADVRANERSTATPARQDPSKQNGGSARRGINVNSPKQMPGTSASASWPTKAASRPASALLKNHRPEIEHILSILWFWAAVTEQHRQRQWLWQQ